MDVITGIYNYLAKGVEFIFANWGGPEGVGQRFGEHLQITGISLLIALLIALPIGFVISRLNWLNTPVLGFLNILYSIPSLAFLAFLIPFFGLGSTTTIVVLIIYAQTMLVRNTALGFNGIDRAVLEAARGMGMSKTQTFRRVELPLAIPVIVAGMRIATLAIVSIATIGAYVGAGGLGKLIFRDPTNAPQVAAAVICIIFIALAADQIYRLIERLITGYRYTKVGSKSAKMVKQTNQQFPAATKS